MTGLPRTSEVVVGPPQPGPGAWAGAPSALHVDGTTYLAYRLRRPVGEGRGFCNVVAALTDEGLSTLAVVGRDRFGADSLERPALVMTPEGRWRLYVSCATPGSKHWRVDLLEADTPQGLAAAPATTVLPGSDAAGVKDPVVLLDRGRWHLWASVHPLESEDDADRMTTDYATSPDGIAWTWQGTVLTGRPRQWDARGVRVTSAEIEGDQLVVTYDGRASAGQNWEENTGVAIGARGPDGRFGLLTALPGPPLASPHGGLRYLTRVALPDGQSHIFYELTRADGAHELRGGRLPAPVAEVAS